MCISNVCLKNSTRTCKDRSEGPIQTVSHLEYRLEPGKTQKLETTGTPHTNDNESLT